MTEEQRHSGTSALLKKVPFQGFSFFAKCLTTSSVKYILILYLCSFLMAFFSLSVESEKTKGFTKPTLVDYSGPVN